MDSTLNIINNTDFDISQFESDFNNIFNSTIKELKIQENIELSLIIVDEETQLNLNKKYRNKNYVADVLTFYLEEDDKDKLNTFNLTSIRELGDIFICYSKALSQSKEYKHSIRRELSFLFIHGMLHSLGYDHIKENEEKVMFSLQNKILNDLRIFRQIDKK